jgi:hypothetical protein
VSSRASSASEEIEALCDTTHVNGLADVHAAYEADSRSALQNGERTGREEPSVTWLALNPVDAFRMVNLPPSERVLAVPLACGSFGLWLTSMLALGAWKMRRSDF